jgi:hypothetical protein
MAFFPLANVILMGVEKQKYMGGKVTRRQVFLYFLSYVACETYRELPIKH